MESSDKLHIQTDMFHPGVSVECVILCFHENKLKVLLNKFHTLRKWMLPGGFIHKNESVDNAAKRHLQSRTGIQNVYLKQFHLFGDTDRLNEAESKRILKGINIPEKEHDWFLRRFMSVGYFAFVKYDNVRLPKESDEDTIYWFDLENLPELYGDHNIILHKGLQTIRYHLGKLPIGYKLLPDKFTMPELRIIYETLLGETLDRRNFQRKVLSVGLIKKLNESRKVGAHKSPLLYAFDKVKYEDMINEELLIDFKGADL